MAEEGAEYFQKDMSNAWSYGRYCGRQNRVMPEGGSAASSQQDESKERQLIVGMWNAHSMKLKMDEIRWLIHTFGFHVLVIVESWLTKPSLGDREGIPRDIEEFLDLALSELVPTEIEIQGYHYPLSYPRNGRGGGILIYLHETLTYDFHDIDVQIQEATNIQYAAIKITQPVQLGLVAVYNPHKNQADALYTLLEPCLRLLRDTDTENVMVLGDFNINLNVEDVCIENERRLRGPYQLDEHIQLATHVGEIRGVPYATHIDHIYYSQARRLCVTFSGVIFRTISDHYPVFCVLGEKSNQESGSTSQSRLQVGSQSRSHTRFGNWLNWLVSENVIELKNANKSISSKPVGSICCLYKKCSLVKVKFSNQEELEQHYGQHHPVCPLPCNKILESKESLVRHQEKCKHFKSTLFKCHYAKCRNEKFGSAEELKKHVTAKHAICPIPCNDILFNKAKLAKHQEKCKRFLAVNSPSN